MQGRKGDKERGMLTGSSREEKWGVKSRRQREAQMDERIVGGEDDGDKKKVWMNMHGGRWGTRNEGDRHGGREKDRAERREQGRDKAEGETEELFMLSEQPMQKVQNHQFS